MLHKKDKNHDFRDFLEEWQLYQSVLWKFNATLVLILSQETFKWLASWHTRTPRKLVLQATKSFTNEAVVILCIHIYEHTSQHSLNTCWDLEDACYGAFTRGKNTYARNWRLEGHLFEGGVCFDNLRYAQAYLTKIYPRWYVSPPSGQLYSVDQLQFYSYKR